VPRATVAGMTNFDDALLRSFLHYDEDEYLSDEYDDEEPSTPLALQPAQRFSLARAIDAGLREHGCDGTLRAAQAWARREKVPWESLRDALDDRGGFCDCEVVMNVLESPG
jgi:uncharacterized protein DUF2695